MSIPVAVTGASGFLGKNFVQCCLEAGLTVQAVPHTLSGDGLVAALRGARIVFHLAGVNRPEDEGAFETGNVGFTEVLCAALSALEQPPAVVYASSTQATRDNAYGRSKQAAERALAAYSARTHAPALVFRLPHIFGKWCRPDYNSVVATFCHNVARGLPIRIDDPDAGVRLVYVDDVVDHFLAIAREPPGSSAELAVEPVYEITIGELARQVEAFRASRATLLTGRVGSGFPRALYATYVSYLPPESFTYPLTGHSDQRGIFVEVLKTADSGQFSYFTAHPGVTRGSHYHHSKTEKFLVLEGRARFRLRHLFTGETFEIFTSGDEPRVVETVPGWVHDITNVGDGKMVVMLWANEVFDRERPDTIAAKV